MTGIRMSRMTASGGLMSASGQAVDGGFGPRHHMPLELEHPPKRDPDRRVVIDQKNPGHPGDYRPEGVTIRAPLCDCLSGGWVSSGVRPNRREAACRPFSSGRSESSSNTTG